MSLFTQINERCSLQASCFHGELRHKSLVSLLTIKRLVLEMLAQALNLLTVAKFSVLTQASSSMHSTGDQQSLLARVKK